MKEIKNSAYVTFDMADIEYEDRKQIEKIFENNFKKFILRAKMYEGKTFSELRELYIDSIKSDIVTLLETFGEYNDINKMDIRGFVEANI